VSGLILVVFGAGGYAALKLLFPDAPLVDYPVLIDLGPRERGEVAIAHVNIRNRGRADLVIDHVTSDCSCSGLEREQDGQFAGFEKLRLPPRESVELALRVAVRGQAGMPFTTYLRFRTNDPQHPEGAIRVVIPNVTGLSIRPTSVGFGEVLVGAQARQEIEVRDVGGDTFEIRGVRSTLPDQVTANLVQNDSALTNSDTTAATLIGRIEVVVKASVEGTLDSTIELDISRSGRRERVAIAVSGRCVRPIVVTPTRITLPRGSGASLVYNGSCLCRHVAGGEFRLEVDSASPGLVASIDSQTTVSATRILRIDWDPKKAPGPALRTVRLKAHDASGEHFIVIQVQCTAKEG